VSVVHRTTLEFIFEVYKYGMVYHLNVIRGLVVCVYERVFDGKD